MQETLIFDSREGIVKGGVGRHWPRRCRPAYNRRFHRLRPR